jgi:hypothetical protein
MERQGIWPGRGWFDAAYLAAIGNASRFIWQHEDFYFDGERVNAAISVSPRSALNREDWVHFVHRREDGRLLLSIFNFTDRELVFEARTSQDEEHTLTVKARHYATKQFRVEPIYTDKQ